MNEGDVVLTPLPQANGLVKLRPAILLRQMPSFGDWLVCGVSRAAGTDWPWPVWWTSIWIDQHMSESL